MKHYSETTGMWTYLCIEDWFWDQKENPIPRPFPLPEEYNYQEFWGLSNTRFGRFTPTCHPSGILDGVSYEADYIEEFKGFEEKNGNIH